MPPLITLLTDFGLRDPWVAICKGVMLSIAPDARLLDISHDTAAYDVIAGAVTLAAVVPAMPVGVHFAVVDPGVGSTRRPIAVRVARGDTFVGPDNGLLLAAADALGGITAAHELRDARFRRGSVSRTFHGRDIFAPAAAHLSLEVPISEFGPSIATDDLVAIDLPVAQRFDRFLQSAVVTIDVYGNVDLAGKRQNLEAVAGPLRAGEELLVQWWVAGGAAREQPIVWAETFNDVGPGEVLVYENALGRISLAVNQGSAADVLGLDMASMVNVGRDR